MQLNSEASVASFKYAQRLIESALKMQCKISNSSENHFGFVHSHGSNFVLHTISLELDFSVKFVCECVLMDPGITHSRSR